ncbi:MAG: glycosyl hydrolase 43 family protein, partial [Bacteroidales bacterium]|nr:glycosyl hydrolase 43 family protein [Bacteroidales bacterium]
MIHKHKILLYFLFVTSILTAQNNVSKTWVADLGNGKYKNPILFADYSDPDVCRVGKDYYMTASSFNCVPGLPILHSKDMINWQLIGHAIDRLEPESIFSKPVHGGGVWAPSIRFHKGYFYIYYGDPDLGIFMLKTNNPAGKWSEPVLVKAGKGLIDPAPLWDDDGKVYLVHAYAGSRAGIKSVLTITELNESGSKAIEPSRIIYDGHEIDPTIEGAKFHKRNGYYYIFAPAGGVANGWQTVLKSENIYGPYERRVVMAQGDTPINGPHQGAWVDTPEGENWFFHFQDRGPFGRVVHLQPMVWQNDWPIIGINADSDGCGEPVLEYNKPNITGKHPITTPPESDSFDSNRIGLQWQWHANPMDWWYYANIDAEKLYLYSVTQPEDFINLWDIPNLLLQKLPSNDFTATAKITFKPLDTNIGERAGLVIMGMDYAML